MAGINPLSNTMVAQLQARLRGAGAPAPTPQYGPPPQEAQPVAMKDVKGLSRNQLHELMMNMVDAEPWIYYDTRIISANIIGNDAAAFNFAQIVSPLPFFNSRTIGNATIALTSMTDNQKTDADFFCSRITVDVWCDTDVASVAGTATGPAFIEEVVNTGIMQIIFGTNTKLLIPLVKCPSGGGVVAGVKTRTQALASNTDSGSANNGLQLSTAAKDLDVPIFFKEGTAFTANMNFPTSSTAAAGPLQRLQGLAPLTGNLSAGIRLNFEGVRGRALLPGSR